MTISIITGTYNSASSILDTLKSVANQTYPHVEHIIVDGGSNDDTVAIAKSFPHVAKIISEPDDGIYDAMNKGIRAATGEVVGMLNSDDFFSSDKVIENIAASFEADTAAVFGDIAFVNPENLEKTVRYYSAANWKPYKFKWGYMPPHPSFYLRSKYYKELGLYQTDYKIAADYELLIRMLYTHKLSYKYLSQQFVTMRTGGVSTQNFKSRYILNKEIIRACDENNINTNMFFLGLKYFRKVFEFVQPEKQRQS